MTDIRFHFPRSPKRMSLILLFYIYFEASPIIVLPIRVEVKDIYYYPDKLFYFMFSFDLPTKTLCQCIHISREHLLNTHGVMLVVSM